MVFKKTISNHFPKSPIVTLYHDIEQDIDSNADKETCRIILKEFLQLEKKYNVTTTYNIVGKIYEEQPNLIKWITSQGQEIAFHSYHHPSDWNKKYYAEEIQRCRQISDLPKGYRSPRSQWNKTTLKTLWKQGFTWNAEGDTKTTPYYIYKDIVRLPIATDDWLLHQGKIEVNRWIQNFEELFNTRSYIAFGSHDYIFSFSPEDRLQAWEKIIKIAIEKDAHFASFSQVADIFRQTTN